MPFVKLDTGILNSTLWFDRGARDVFITALLMAEPYELREPMPQIAVDSLEHTGWIVPPGWYGFVPAAGVGILHRAGIDDASGLEALRVLGSPEPSSRTPDFDGRRLVRIDGGYLVLNFIKYREKDASAAERQRRWRERQKRAKELAALPVTESTLRVIRNQAEADAQADAYPLATLVERETNAPLTPEALGDLWNATTTDPIPRCLSIGTKRRTHAKARLSEHPEPLWWRLLFERIQASAFCRGENDRGWVATFDWIVANDENAGKVLEGKYDNRAGAGRTSAAPMPTYDDDWCQHDPRCATREVHMVMLAREGGGA